jgi:hypothetical protein
VVAVVLGRIDRANAQRELVGDWIEATVAEGITAQQAPTGEQ